MKKYEKCEIEIIKFANDIITSSTGPDSLNDETQEVGFGKFEGFGSKF